jgi:hypothetical protein
MEISFGAGNCVHLLFDQVLPAYSNSCCQFTIVCFSDEIPNRSEVMCWCFFLCSKIAALWYIYSGAASFSLLIRGSTARPRLPMTCLHKKTASECRRASILSSLFCCYFLCFLLPRREITWGKSLWLKSMHKQQQFIVLLLLMSCFLCSLF